MRYWRSFNDAASTSPAMLLLTFWKAPLLLRASSGAARAELIGAYGIRSMKTIENFKIGGFLDREHNSFRLPS